ncbi:MAG: TonB-dependent receptor [Gemmatimonadota bacterium]
MANLIGSARTASEGHVGTLELRSRPLAREGELLETVPGVIVTQHSGEGKANQYFVRGFNLDHGTDFQTMVDGMPVNQPTHAHGQGYTDLNFLVPEFVRSLDYKLGVSHAELGDFGSAGGAEFNLARRFDAPVVVTEMGANGLARVVLGRSVKAAGGDLLFGGEGKQYDGPWQRAERLRKYSSMARYSMERGASQFSVLAMAYTSRWDASDQIPQRAIRSGALSRFGQVDSTLGGNTSRYSLSALLRRVGTGSVQEYQTYVIRSALDLTSNFTYFLDDPVNGDQFQQLDARTVVGGSATHLQPFTRGNTTHLLKVGLQTRADLAGVSLHRTARRERVRTVRYDDVREVGTGLFIENESRWTPWFRTVLGARADGYLFHVDADRQENGGSRAAAIVSPKVSLIATPGAGAEVYISGGTGFHSNDARGTTIRIDPVTGDEARPVDPLVRSRGGELGLRVAPLRGLRTTLSLWALRLDSELLFVGDAGATEPTTESRRSGVTLANYYAVTRSLALDADVSVARARLHGVPQSQSFLPGALERVIAAGVTWNSSRRASHAALRVRHFGAYPLIDDGSRRAQAATLLNADAGIRVLPNINLQLTVLNLLGSRAADIQYLYSSRLRGEAEGVTDVHLHPVEPRQLRLSLRWTN